MGAEGLGQVGSGTLSSARQSGQGTPSIRGTAWAGSGWSLEGQCQGKARDEDIGVVVGVQVCPALGVRRVKAGKAVVSVYGCRC